MRIRIHAYLCVALLIVGLVVFIIMNTADTARA